MTTLAISGALELPDYAPIPASAFGPPRTRRGTTSGEWSGTSTG
jgi:hypothetical protein